jgi:streptogramin lyase
MTKSRFARLAVAMVSAIAMMGIARADPVLNGKISSESGAKLDGVTVSAKRDGSTITTSVYTDKDGMYYFPPLAAGHYHVWAQALGFEATKLAVDLAARTRQDMTLNAITDPERRWRQLPGELMMASLPANTRHDAYMKKLFSNNCTPCHTPSFVLQSRFDEEGWMRMITVMKAIAPGSQIIDMNQRQLAAYLAKVRGPGAPPQIKERPRPSGEAARAVWTLYDVPRGDGIGSATFGARPPETDGADWAMGTPSMLGTIIHDEQLDFDGNIWFTSLSWSTSLNPNNQVTIGKVDGATGAVTYKKVAMTDPANHQAARSHGMTRDHQGFIWFNLDPGRGSLGKLDPKTGEIVVYTPPPGMQEVGGATTLDVDGKGMIWASADWGVLRFDPQTLQFTAFKSLRPKRPYGTGMTYGAAGDRDGNGWWAEMGFDTIGKANTATGETTEIVLPENKPVRALLTPKQAADYRKITDIAIGEPYPWGQGPRRMGTDKNADVLWVGDSWGANLARIDTRTNAVTLVPTPDPALQPYHVSVDSHHDVWSDLWTADEIVRYSPDTKKWTIFELPVRGSEIRHITADETGGALKVSMAVYRTNQLAVLRIRSEADLAKLKEQISAQ